jgi:uncharacterized protein YbaR (Trm112 family)
MSSSRQNQEGKSDGKQWSKPPRSPSQTSKRVIGQPPSSPISFDFARVINTQDLLEIAACPCCKQNIDERKQQTLSGPRIVVDPYTSLAHDIDSLDSDDEDTLPRGVAEGLHYQPKRILVEGWLHKKGTGNDWIGSKSWKPRWARLVVSFLSLLAVSNS